MSASSLAKDPRAGATAPAGSRPAVITEREFALFRRFIYDAAGISLSPSKCALVGGRLARRLRHYQLPSYEAYYALLMSGTVAEEVQLAIELLTTNETSFFREPSHFELLRQYASAPRASGPFRLWSAASSSGEEAYSAAMVLADCLGDAAWEVFGSDINTQVLDKACHAHYAMERAETIPPAYLRRFCLRGAGPQEGSFLIDRALRQHVHFAQLNLNAPLPSRLGSFDVIFLRNVMIYFDESTKQAVVRRLLEALRPAGHLFVGHSESLIGLGLDLQPVAPGVYRRAA